MKNNVNTTACSNQSRNRESVQEVACERIDELGEWSLPSGNTVRATLLACENGTYSVDVKISDLFPIVATDLLWYGDQIVPEIQRRARELKVDSMISELITMLAEEVSRHVHPTKKEGTEQ